MSIEALVEMEALPPSRRFVFTNSYEPEDEGGNAYLDVTAEDFSVKKL